MTDDYSFATPVTPVTPTDDYSFATPVQQPVPAGPVRQMNIQSNDVGAARFGTEYGTSRPTPPPSQPTESGPIGRAVKSFALGAGAPLYSLTGQLASGFGMFPNQLAEGQTDIANQANQYRQELMGQGGGLSQFATNLAGQAGQMSTFMPLSAAAGIPALEAGVGGLVGETAMNSLAGSTLGRVGWAAGRSAMGGLLASPLMTAMNPTDSNKSFGQNVAEAVPSNMLQMGLMGGGLGAIGEVPSVAKAGGGWIRQRFSGEHVAPSVIPEDLPSVSEVMSQPEVHGRTVPQLQAAAQMGEVGADRILQQVRLAASVEHGQPTATDGGDNIFVQPINLSEADRTGDPIARQDEQNLEGMRGSVGRNARVAQGRQINNAIRNLGDRTDATLSVDPQTGQRADPSTVISDGAQEQYDANRATAIAKYEGVYGAIADRLADAKASGNPINAEVDITQPVQRMMELMEQNKVTLAQDPELNNILSGYAKQIESHLADPLNSESMLSVRGVKNAVSNMESQAEQMKGGQNPNRNGARLIKEVSDLFDQAADQKATEILGTDAPIRDASNYYKNNVVPFFDHDSGLPQIREGMFPDKATKAFLGTSSPDQFKSLMDLLPDPAVKQALKSKLLEAATDSATSDRTSQLEPQKWAAFLAKRGAELPSLYTDPAELHSVQSLVDLVQNTPRAGSVAQPTSSLNMTGGSYVRKGLSSLAGALTAGPAGAIVAPLLEEAPEIAFNRYQSRNAFVPDINDTAAKLGMNDIRSNQTPRSLGAAARPTEPLTSSFRSPQPNPTLTLQGKAGTTYADPYAGLKSAQDAYAAAQGETQFSQSNLTRALSHQRDLVGQIRSAEGAARDAAEAAGGQRPTGWSQVDRDAQHQAYDRKGQIISSYDPTDLGVRDLLAPEGTSTLEERQFLNDVLHGVPGRAANVREPSPDEMREVADRLGSFMDYLQTRGLSGKEEVLLPNNIVPRHYPGSANPYATVPYEFHPGTPEELRTEYNGLAQTRASILDFAQRTENGEFPQSGEAAMGLINDLSQKTSRVRDLRQALKDSATSPINVNTLKAELASAQADEFDAFQQVRRNAVNQRQPVPAINPQTQGLNTLLTAPFTGEGSSISNPRGTQTSTTGVPEQSVNSLSEAFHTPRSGTGSSLFDVRGGRSVGAAENPFEAGESELNAALQGRQRNLQNGAVPTSRPTPTPLPSPTKPGVPPPAYLPARTQPSMDPVGLKAQFLALLGLHPSQNPSPLNPQPTGLPQTSSTADINRLAQQMIDQNPEMGELLRDSSVMDVGAGASKQYSTAETDRLASELIAKQTGRPISKFFNVPEPNSPADVSAAKQFTLMFDEETKNLQDQHKGDIRDALANGATPGQIQNLRADQAAIIKQRVGWNTIAKGLARKGSDAEWLEHMKEMPR